jgi:hypothetical protein
MRIGKLPISACWLNSDCANTIDGSTTSTMKPMPISFHFSVWRKVSRDCVDSQSTIEPTKPNIQTSAIAIPAEKIAAAMISGHVPRA